MWDHKMRERLRKMNRKIDRLFGNLGTIGFGRGFEDDNGEIGKYRKAWANFKESKNEYIMEIELPGVEKEDIKLDVAETGIEIRAERRSEIKRENKKKGLYSYSKDYSGFARVIDLPEDSDLNNVDAVYKNGVLTIRVGKKKIKVQKRGREVKIR